MQQLEENDQKLFVPTFGGVIGSQVCPNSFTDPLGIADSESPCSYSRLFAAAWKQRRAGIKPPRFTVEDLQNLGFKLEGRLAICTVEGCEYEVSGRVVSENSL